MIIFQLKFQFTARNPHSNIHSTIITHVTVSTRKNNYFSITFYSILCAKKLIYFTKKRFLLLSPVPFCEKLFSFFAIMLKKVAYIRFRCDRCVCVIFHPLNFEFHISPTIHTLHTFDGKLILWLKERERRERRERRK